MEGQREKETERAVPMIFHGCIQDLKLVSNVELANFG